MHDTESPSSQSQASLREEAVVGLPKSAGRQPQAVASATGASKPLGLMARIFHFVARLLKGKKQEQKPAQLTAADRLAAARAARVAPPMAFKGDTANTLITPMGAYAGKPVEQAMRKRAEQQFKNMDITRTTMN